MKTTIITLVVIGAALTGAIAQQDVKAPKPEQVLRQSVTDINGKRVPLSSYRGKVLLIVNTASRCGNTPQYAGLETIYTKYKNKGFVVLAFPSNDFGAQEPGTNAEIREFCASKYNVTFPLFSKVVVKGPAKCELYRTLTELPKPIGGEIEWNFAKFLVNRKGNVVARFPAGMKPETPAIVTAIEKELATKR